MDKAQFWTLIEESREGISDCEEQSEKLTNLLAALPPQEIVGFAQQLHERLTEAYRWDLWGAAYLINGGCSDDGFEYFRGWVISQGQEFYESVLANPERAADKINNDADYFECEDILYASLQAYEKVTGREMPHLDLKYPDEPEGDPWTEEDLDELYPSLSERFSA